MSIRLSSTRRRKNLRVWWHPRESILSLYYWPTISRRRDRRPSLRQVFPLFSRFMSVENPWRWACDWKRCETVRLSDDRAQRGRAVPRGQSRRNTRALSSLYFCNSPHTQPPYIHNTRLIHIHDCVYTYTHILYIFKKYTHIYIFIHWARQVYDNVCRCIHTYKCVPRICLTLLVEELATGRWYSTPGISVVYKGGSFVRSHSYNWRKSPRDIVLGHATHRAARI